MSSSKSLKLCRLLVAVLLFNMVVPVIQAAESGEAGYVLMCTSAGLVKVSLEGSSENPPASKGNHCPYCKLGDLSLHFVASNLPYPAPNSDLELNYLSFLAPLASQYVIKHVQVRAPPIHI